MVVFLGQDFNEFPDISLADEDGLLAVGGNLDSTTLLNAYQQGIFPWYSEGEPICWYAPHERCVIFPKNIKISKSMQGILKKERFKITVNEAFEAVIANCASISRPDQNGTWILDEMQSAYKEMYHLGYAKSIEVWENNQLVGGLYGIDQGHIFCGESMFSSVPNASKIALIFLCTQMQYQLIDCQIENPHLISMGAEIISSQKFIEILHSK